MPILIHVCNAHSGAISVRYGVDKVLMTSEKMGRGAGIAIGGKTEEQESEKISRKFENISIEEGFTEILPGQDMAFSLATNTAYLTIRENEKELCANKEIIKSSNFIVDSKGQLRPAQDGTKYWIDKDGNFLKPTDKGESDKKLALKMACLKDDISMSSDAARSTHGIQMNERRILVIGKTGVGKSTTSNTILGQKSFVSSVSARSITKKADHAIGDRFGRKLVIVDTPGLCDTATNKSDEEVIDEIKKCYGMTAPGLHAVILVVKVDRFGEEEEKTVNLFTRHFGQTLLSYLIVAFAGKDALEHQDLDITEFIRTLEDDSNMKQLLNDINKRYVVFGFRSKRDADKLEREEEVKDLLDLIDNMVKTNGQQYFTNKSYEEAEGLIQRELDKRMEDDEDKRKHRELYQELLKNQYTYDEIMKQQEALEEFRKQHEKREDLKKQQEASEEFIKQHEEHEELKKQQEALEEFIKQHEEHEELKKQQEAFEEFRKQHEEYEDLKKQLEAFEEFRKQHEEHEELKKQHEASGELSKQQAAYKKFKEIKLQQEATGEFGTTRQEQEAGGDLQKLRKLQELLVSLLEARERLRREYYEACESERKKRVSLREIIREDVQKEKSSCVIQ